MAKYHMVFYVDNSTPRFKKFKTIKSMNQFIMNFKHDPGNGYWIDYSITNITGEFKHFEC
jgi:hypothetical protein